FDILQRDGFVSKRNAKAAMPRQTDLFASYKDTDFLIEVKWKSKKIDIADVASLKDRLRRVPTDIIAVIFGMSMFTDQAISEIQSDRSREILLVNSEEVAGLVSQELNVFQLVQRKR